MVNIAELINQDLTVAEKHLANKKFDFINIIGNRILQNLFVIDKKELMIIGLILKEISNDLLHVNAIDNKKNRNIEPCISFAKDCFEAIRLATKKEISLLDIWKAYFSFEEKIGKYQLLPDERAIYKEDADFSKEATLNYITILVRNKNYLLKKNIFPLERTRAELATLVQIHDGMNTILSYMVVRAFEHVYRFALYGKVQDEEIESIVSTNIDKLSNIAKLLENGDETELIEFANTMVGDLMYSYRVHFVLYGDIKGEFVEEMPLSPDVSQKIQKIIDRQKGR